MVSEDYECFRFAGPDFQTYPYEVKHLIKQAVENLPGLPGQSPSDYFLQNCSLLRAAKGRPFFDYISEVIVPTECADETEKLIHGAGYRALQRKENVEIPNTVVFRK